MSDRLQDRRLLRGLVPAIARAWLGAPAPVRWLLPVSLMAALWWSSSRTPTPGEPWLLGEVLHNAMHVVAFGALGGAFWFACRGPAGRGAGRTAAWLAFLLAVTYGVVDELHQAAVPGRVSSIYDALSDACGAAGAVLVLRRWRAEIPPSPWLLPAFLCTAAACVALATWA